jgi:hypothetical protein
MTANALNTVARLSGYLPERTVQTDMGDVGIKAPWQGA